MSQTLTRVQRCRSISRNLIDDDQCYQPVRAWRWPDGIACPSCQFTQVMPRGFDDTALARQRSECHDWHQRFDDLTNTMLAGHHQPLQVWRLCRYFRGLHVSNDHIAEELDVDRRAKRCFLHSLSCWSVKT
jgi:Transposase zinc-ribbon domain